MNLLSFLIIIFCTLSNTLYGMHKKSDSSDVIWAMKLYAMKVKKEKNIQLAIYGINCAGADKIYDGKVHLIDMGFRIDKKMKYDEARKLFYSIADGLLEDLNKNESIRDLFYHYPLTYKDLYLRLNFDYESNGHLKRDEIYMIAILENEIMYFIVEEDGGTADFTTKQIVPDVHMITNFSTKTRCITKSLPEKD